MELTIFPLDFPIDTEISPSFTCVFVNLNLCHSAEICSDPRPSNVGSTDALDDELDELDELGELGELDELDELEELELTLMLFL